MDKEEYDEILQSELDKSLEIVSEAKKGTEDPDEDIGMEIAEDLAERCEKLLGIPGLSERIRELDEDYDREELVFKIAEDFAEGRVGEEDMSDEEIVDATIRASVAILTEGIVAAPIDGIGEISLETGDDGQRFIRVPYFGPIRSAGGTGQALSVLIADYIRQLLGIGEFKARDDEVERYIEEVKLYDDDVSLQYLPPDEDIRHIIKNCPVMIDGEQTRDLEVGGYRDLERITGNRLRGGMCLVIGEGIGLKAPKMKRYIDSMGIDGWDWIDELIETSTDEEDENENENQEIKRKKKPKKDWDKEIKPSKKYTKDTLGGRPIFSTPSNEGGFRLRYGRARNIGMAACGYHPASMVIVEEFIANGSQLKTERPGKAAGVASVDSIEGPMVRLKTGEVKRIEDEDEARRIIDGVDEIIDLGETLVPYGEFLENNHPIGPSPYVHEWWVQEYEEKTGGRIPEEKITYQLSKELSEEHDIPLHPKYTYLWHDITNEEYQKLAEQIQNPPIEKEASKILEKLLIPHKKKKGFIQLEKPHSKILKETLSTNAKGENPVEKASNTLGIEIRHRSPIKIGTRLGRPEKSQRREMSPPVNSLYPIGEKGGNTRDISKAAKNKEGGEVDLEGNAEELKVGKTTVELANMICPECRTETWKPKCPKCGERTKHYWKCPDCGKKGQEGDRCQKCKKQLQKSEYKELNISKEFKEAMDKLNVRETHIDMVKGVKGLTSTSKIPEPIEKGILRAKHDIDTFRDGTSRYDMTDLPLTSFKPKEIGITVQQTKQLGYTEDINGNPIQNENQIIEIMPQDIIVSKDCAEYLKRAADFIDELLEKYYNTEPYYNAETKQDLIGELLIGLAPHTSAGVMGRLIGYTDALANYASPFYHAAKRRNCFHPETELNYKINGEWKNSSIKELVEKYLNPQYEGYDDSYDDGSIVQNIKEHPEIEELKVPSRNEEGHSTLEDVTHISKHPNKGRIIRIETEEEKEIRVTPEHGVPIHEDSELKVKEAIKIEEDDELYSFDDSLKEIKNFQEVDILRHVLSSEKTNKIDTDNLMIRGIGKDKIYEILESYIRKQYNYKGDYLKMSTPCEVLDISKKELDNYLRRDSIPLELFVNLYDNDKEKIIEEIPKRVKLGMRMDNVEFPRIITIDEEVACLIGYYTAEGYTRYTKDDLREGNKTGVRQTYFAALEDRVREFIDETLSTKFGVEDIYKDEESIVACGAVLNYFFSEILNAGRVSNKKRVPDLIKRAQDSIKASYLSGYISGDGNMDKSNETLGMDTVSKELKEDIIGLFDSMGYSSMNVTKRSPRLLRNVFPKKYESDDNSMSRESYKIRLSKEESRDFVNNYGIHLRRKEGGYQRLIETETVSNVSIETTKRDTYNLTVDNTHRLEANSLLQQQCDGDEDSVMLLMDGLLNFSEKYLPDLRGKRSVGKDQRVFVNIDGEHRAMKISNLVDSYIDSYGNEERPDGFEVTRDVDEDVGVLSFDPETYEVDYSPVSAFIRHPNDKEVYNVKTRRGEITVTEDHSLFTSDNGEIVEATVGELEVGDSIIKPDNISIDGFDDLKDEVEKRVENSSGDRFEFRHSSEEFVSHLSVIAISLGYETEVFYDDKDDEYVFAVDEWDDEVVQGSLGKEDIIDIERVDYGDDFVYDLEVPERQNFLCGPHPIFAHNTMDAPLVMTSRLDPYEVDDEAYNVDIEGEYPLEFYEKSMSVVDPGEVDVSIAEECLEDGALGLMHSFETSDISKGPSQSAYKDMSGMEDIVKQQLELAKKSRGADESMVGRGVLKNHVLTDIIGNLRAFSTQEVRCAGCNTKYRRPPLSGECGNCGNDLILTIHNASVDKYLDIADYIVETCDVSKYMEERVKLVENRIEQLFNDDSVEQAGLDDFMD
jgi:DNA polymerase II large subunit